MRLKIWMGGVISDIIGGDSTDGTAAVGKLGNIPRLGFLADRVDGGGKIGAVAGKSAEIPWNGGGRIAGVILYAQCRAPGL